MGCRVCGKPLAPTNKSGVHTKCMTSADKHARLFARYKHSTTGERGNPEQWRQTFLLLFQGAKDDLSILGLSSLPDTLQEAKTTYRRLMMEHHPDRGGSVEKAAEINSAYERVMKRIDGNKRKDTGLRAQLPNPITEQEAERYLKDDVHCLQEKKDGKHILLGIDGNYRVLAANKQGLETTIGTDISVAVVKIFGINSVVDGELIGDNFWVFDLLMHNSSDLRKLSYGERYKQLSQLMDTNSHPNLYLVKAYFSAEEKVKKYNEIKAAGREGVVFKKIHGKFSEGRPHMGGDMLKCKFWKSCSAIVDETPTGKSSFTFYVLDENGDRVSLGNCSAIGKIIPKPGNVVEIRYLYRHNEGKLCQAVFLGIRDDVDSKSCTLKQLEVKQ